MSLQQSTTAEGVFTNESSSSLSLSYNSSKKRNHPLFVSGLFDIFAHVSSQSFLSHFSYHWYPFLTADLDELNALNVQVDNDVTTVYGLRESHTTIVASGLENSSVIEYAIKASSYGSADIILRVDGVYFFSGRLLALNKPGIQSFYYNSEHRLLSTTSNALEGDLTNNTTVVGLGIILSRTTTPDPDGKTIVVAKVLHTDYNPEVCCDLSSIYPPFFLSELM